MKSICITGGGGFIGHHLARRLKSQGHYVRVVDIRREYLKDSDCDEFLLLDLRNLENCILATTGCDWVFSLAADMGGMGFIQTNQSLILYNNTMISFNTLEASRRNGVKRFFYSSSACCYPEHIQDDPNVTALAEDTAWPANPQELYGLEKIVTEQLVMRYAIDFGMTTRIARFHNIYGPEGTWTGGREKAPAAFCRKVLAAVDGQVEIWGDGVQTRSFCYIEDCLDGILRIMESDFPEPLNLGSDYLISMNDFIQLVAKVGNKTISVKNILGPQGVRGRNSDNTLIEQVLGWVPTTSLEDGITETYKWIEQAMADASGDEDYSKSKIVETSENF